MNIFEKLLKNIKDFFLMDKYVNTRRKDEIFRNQKGIIIISFFSFLVMSFINWYAKSWIMLSTTVSGCIILLITYIIARINRNNISLVVGILIVYIVIFSAYIIGIGGGNEGFSPLWVLLATYVVLIGIDSKLGLLVSVYFTIFIFIVYQTPAQSILQYKFNADFKLRFPYLFIINFALAIYILVSLRHLQYYNFKKQEELEKIYNIDQLTNVYNRNKFIEFSHKYNKKNCRKVACFYIDVNGMHNVNNSKGHEAGDCLLKDIAYELKNDFSNGTIFRMGGDEFLVIILDADEKELKDRIELFIDANEKANYAVSTGYSYKEDDVDIDSLVKEADNYMLINKKKFYELHKSQRIEP